MDCSRLYHLVKGFVSVTKVELISPTPSFDWLAMIQCAMVVWGTNISINYGNEYFDWEMDRVSAVAAIKRDMGKRSLKGLKSHDQTMSSKKALNEKIMG